jgi:hypothetical protein
MLSSTNTSQYNWQADPQVKCIDIGTGYFQTLMTQISQAYFFTKILFIKTSRFLQ